MHSFLLLLFLHKQCSPVEAAPPAHMERRSRAPTGPPLLTPSCLRKVGTSMILNIYEKASEYSNPYQTLTVRILSNPLNSSCFDDPAVEVAEDEADKEALERQECSFDQVEDLGNQNRFDLRQKKSWME